MSPADRRRDRVLTGSRAFCMTPARLESMYCRSLVPYQRSHLAFKCRTLRSITLFILYPLPISQRLPIYVFSPFTSSFSLVGLAPCPVLGSPVGLLCPAAPKDEYAKRRKALLSITGQLTQFGIVSNVLNKKVGGRGGARGLGALCLSVSN